MHSLIYVPIIHSETELGSLAEEVRRQFEHAFGNEEWLRRDAAIQAMWNGIRSKLLALPLHWCAVRLYQDGLPVCGRETDIVRELAERGSQNHRLLIELMDRGATLMGTEDPGSLVAEYRRLQKLAQASRGAPSANEMLALKEEGRALLAARDRFIARRIETSLGESETGVLFVGLMHRVDELVDSAFTIRDVIHSLPFDADLLRRLKEVGRNGE